MRTSALTILLAALIAFATGPAFADPGAEEAKGDSEQAEKNEEDEEELSKEEMRALLEEMDERQRSSGDFKGLVYIDQREKEKSDLLYEAVIYRRDSEDKMAILFTKPKSEKGKGYLRIDKNLFLYDPNVGKWERRTERERIGGTSSRRRDFDASRLADLYDPSYVAREELGKYEVHHLKLEAKDDDEVAYPILEAWVAVDSKNLLKLQEFALSGRLMRTTYYPKWRKVKSEETGKDVYFPKEIRVYDEVEKGNRTIILFRAVELKELPDNIFTKAWVESKSR